MNVFLRRLSMVSMLLLWGLSCLAETVSPSSSGSITADAYRLNCGLLSEEKQGPVPDSFLSSRTDGINSASAFASGTATQGRMSANVFANLVIADRSTGCIWDAQATYTGGWLDYLTIGGVPGASTTLTVTAIL